MYFEILKVYLLMAIVFRLYTDSNAGVIGAIAVLVVSSLAALIVDVTSTRRDQNIT